MLKGNNEVEWNIGDKIDYVVKNVIIRYGDMLFISDDYNYGDEQVISKFNYKVVEYNGYNNLDISLDCVIKNDNYVRFNNDNLDYNINSIGMWNKELYERGRLDSDLLLDFICAWEVNYLYNVISKINNSNVKKVIVLDVNFMMERD